jgi:REP element-mobilizing transposase RayT
MKYNPDIHHRRSIRLKGHDYSQSGAYFVTICAQNRECLLGDVVDGRIRVNDAGQMVQRIWNDLSVKYPGIETDAFVVMPNHIHGIIVIVGAQFIAPINCNTINQTKKNESIKQGAINRAPTVGEIVRAFKAQCTHAINQIRNTPGHPVWQRNYYEHVVRNDDGMKRVREYVISNPAKWDNDENNPTNIP